MQQVTARPDEPSAGVDRKPGAELDPRLDTTTWRVFGRRFPRRWSLYFRVVAAVLLVLSLGWWFTRDLTYVSNVKVSGLDATVPAYRGPLKVIADDFAALVNRLADDGYGWQPGGLPALRAAGALSTSEAADYVAIGTVEVKKKGGGLRVGTPGDGLVSFMSARGWTTGPNSATIEGAFKDQGQLRATIALDGRPEGRERVTLRIAVRDGS